MVKNQGIIDHDLRKEIKILNKLFLLSTIVFSMTKLLRTLQVKAYKTVIKESHSVK